MDLVKELVSIRKLADFYRTPVTERKFKNYLEDLKGEGPIIPEMEFLDDEDSPKKVQSTEFLYDSFVENIENSLDRSRWDLLN